MKGNLKKETEKIIKQNLFLFSVILSHFPHNTFEL